MKKTLATIAAAIMLASAGAALAAESQGKIKMIDLTTMTLILEDGTAYQVGDNVAVETLKPGQEVAVSYETKDGKHQANKVTVKK